MQYLSQKELREMLLRSYERIEVEKENINKINVFPVPDQDTGNNMAKTLSGIKEAIAGKEFGDIDEISAAALDGALVAAQGNAGVIYTGFLAGFLPSLNKNPVDANKLVIAFEKGAKRARDSIQKPQEGTILDVIDAANHSLKENVGKEPDIVKLLKTAVEKANDALLATREKMEIFKKANVVDAGGLGFLIILESYLEALEGEEKEIRRKEKPSEKIRRFVQVLAYRYEVVALIEDPRVEESVIRSKLSKLGNYLDIVQVENKMKIHVHTDYPNEIREIITRSGTVLSLRTEDMAREVVGEESVRKKVSIGIVTDDIAMLLPKIIEKYQIEIVPTKYYWPEEKNFPGENLYQRLREADRRGVKVVPTTSQATPKSYFNAYRKQLQKFDKVLSITLSSKVSGCYNSAIRAKEMLNEDERKRVYILDSFNGAAGEALIILRAIELIQEQREISEVIEEIKNLISKVHLYVIFENPKWIENIGRITHSQANWIRRIKKIGLHPLIKMKEGKLIRGGIVFAKDMAEALLKVAEKDSKKVRKEVKQIRAVIGHADNLEQANKLKKMLKEKIHAEVSFIGIGPAVVCVGAGPGTLLLGWMAIE